MALITKQEKDVIQQLRDEIQDLFQKDVSHSHKNDAFLLRFLRDQDMNVSSAEASLRRYITWKKEVRQNELRNENIQESLRNLLPLRYGTFDRTGKPVFILPIGRWAVELTADVKNSAHFVEYFFLMMDKVVAEINSVQKEGELELALGIMDMDQLSYKQMHKDVFPVVLTTVGDMRKYYPEIFHLCSIINAPTGFSLMFKLVKAVIPKRYTERITIYGRNRNEWVSVLQQKISLDQLCKDYGGEYEHKLQTSSGI